MNVDSKYMVTPTLIHLVSSKHQFSNFHLSWQICKSKMSQLMENDLTKQINFSNLCNIHDLHISQDRWKLK